MRETKDITITEDGNEFKFRIKQMSAYGLQTWGIKVMTTLGESGLFNLSGDQFTNFNIDEIFKALGKNGTSFLGKLDPDKANALIFELVCKCTSRINGNAISALSEDDLENLFFDIRSLIQLEKEVFAVNFMKYVGEIQSNSPTSNLTESGTSKRGITVQPSHR